MSDVFISYSRKDDGFVRWLGERLIEQGRDVWVDWEDIPPSTEWRREVREAIEGADAFVFVISPDSLASIVCREELDHAADLNKRIVPVVCRDPGQVPAPDAVSALNWVFCRTDAERKAGVARVVEALDLDLEWTKAHTRLLVRALEWESKHDRSMLLRGGDLENAEAALALHEREYPAPTESQRRYVLASRQNATRRLRGAVSVSLVALTVIAALAVVSVVQARHAHETAQIALSRQLAGDANAQLDQDAQLGLSLALHAYDTRPTVEAQAAIRRAAFDTRERALLRGSTAPISAVAFNPDGRHVVSVGDGTAHIWDWRAPDAAPVIIGVGVLSRDVAFSPDGARLVAATDRGLAVWDWRHAARPPVVLGSSAPERFALSADGRHVATSELEAVNVRDLRHPDDPPVVLATGSSVAALALSPDGSHLATTDSTYKSVRVWDVHHVSDSPVELTTGADAFDVAFSPDGKLLAIAGNATEVRDWQHPEMPPMLHATDDFSSSVAFSPRGDHLAAGGDIRISVYDIRHPGASPFALVNNGGFNGNISFSPDNVHLVTGGIDEAVRVWSWRDSDAVPAVLHATDDNGTIESPRQVAFNADGTLVAAAYVVGPVRIWKWHEPGAAPIVLSGDGSDAEAVAFSPDGTHLATVGAGHAAVWDLRHPEQRPVVFAESSALDGALAFNADGIHVATAGTSAVFVWDWKHPTRKPTELALPEGDTALALAFSPNGSRLAVAGRDTTARVWRWRRPRLHPTVFRGHAGPVHDVAFSDDGAFLATASTDTTARVWRLAHPRERPIVLRGHTKSVLALAFSPDGSTLVTTSDDATVRVWQWRHPEGAPITASGIVGLYGDAAFSPDGRHFATTLDNDVQVWSCHECGAIAEVVRLARTRVDRPLSREQRRNYLHQ